ncbi:hypothetical protein CANMA_003570 [Candida margitis]|uniref:uncharacterized protein n=1 Tax=Candida margitis TaxID=1775924 RepID=UPI0022279180|nr:uncharacterized protein CANMA_003570 [Candida margitis]KAI5963973.1 hypothetical protein CANMA_003570 [Candida margitis]
MTTSRDPNVIGSHYEVDGEVHQVVPRLRRQVRRMNPEVTSRLELRANTIINEVVDHNFTELSINESNGRGGAGSLSNFYSSLNSNSFVSNSNNGNTITHAARRSNDFPSLPLHGVHNNDHRVRFQDSSFDQSSIRDSISDNGRQIPTATGGGGAIMIGASPKYLQQTMQQVCLALDLSFTEANMAKIIDKITELKTTQSMSFQTQTWMNERNNLHKKISSFEEAVKEKNEINKALNLDLHDLKQVETQHIHKIELLEAQLKESSMNAAKTISELLECKSTFESFENDSNNRFQGQQEQIQQLERDASQLRHENLQLNQDLPKLKSENSDLIEQNQSLAANIESVTQSHSEDKAQWEKKLRHYKKQVLEKETKLESMANQIATIKTKCNRKLITLENDHNSALDSLCIEIQILRNIIDKHFESGANIDYTITSPDAASVTTGALSAPTRSKSLSIHANSNNSNVKDAQASRQPSQDLNPAKSPPFPEHLLASISTKLKLTASTSTSTSIPTGATAKNQTTQDPSTLYIRQLYENRYLQALKDQKDLADSNTINHATLANLLHINLHYFEKLVPKHDRLNYFKLLIKEYEMRKIVQSIDLNLIKKLVETDSILMSDVNKRLNELDKYVL